MKIKTDLSPNCSFELRLKKRIKFIIIHYTGMQSEIESIKRLKNIKSKVSCHYLIDRKGKILKMVDDNKVAWHAGKSKWKNFKNLCAKLLNFGIKIILSILLPLFKDILWKKSCSSAYSHHSFKF